MKEKRIGPLYCAGDGTQARLDPGARMTGYQETASLHSALLCVGFIPRQAPSKVAS